MRKTTVNRLFILIIAFLFILTNIKAQNTIVIKGKDGESYN